MARFAFVFPGQGSQAVGMLDAWGAHPAVRETLAEASDALGEDLAALIREGPKEALALTTNTQPVMLAADIACWRAWYAEGGALPEVVAGHSLGEFAALVAADALALAIAHAWRGGSGLRSTTTVTPAKAGQSTPARRTAGGLTKAQQAWLAAEKDARRNAGQFKSKHR